MAAGNIDRALCEAINQYLEIGINVSDIQSPKAEVVQVIYRQFLMVTMAVPEASLQQIPFECKPSDSEIYDSHARCFPIAILYSTMKTFFSDFVDGLVFSLEDLLSPAKNTRRTRKLLHTIVDYMRHYQTLNNIFAEAAGKYEAKREELTDALKEMEVAERRKDDLMNKRNTRKREENALNVKLGDARKKFTQINEENTNLERSVEAKQSSIEEHKQILEQLIYEHEGLRAQVDTLSMELISSPERVTKELANYRDELKNLISFIDKQRRMNKDTQNMLDSAPMVDKLIESLQNDVSKIDALKLEIEADRLTRDEWQEKMHSVDRSISKKKLDIENLQRKQQDAEADLGSLKNDHQTRMNELTLRYTELNSDVTSLRNEQGRHSAEQANIIKDITGLKKAKADMMAQYKYNTEKIAAKSIQIVKKYEDEVALINEQMNLYQQYIRKIANSTKVKRCSNSTFDESLL